MNAAAVAGASTPSIAAAAAAGDSRCAVVSLHDVAPLTLAASEKIILDLRRLGVSVCSLLVVPDYHHTGRATADADFVRWLRGCEGEGHEVVVHGYYHQRPRPPRESVRDRFITGFYTAGEGEFYDIDYATACERLAQARSEFTSAGLNPRGFIAPAWLLSNAARNAARDCEFEYTTSLTSVDDLRSAHRYPARTLVYSVRAPWRRILSRGWNSALFRRLTAAPLLRLSIHPPDLAYPQLWEQIRRLISQIAETRRPMTYVQWLDERRGNTAG
jgi:predicted deacetylase